METWKIENHVKASKLNFSSDKNVGTEKQQRRNLISSDVMCTVQKYFDGIGLNFPNFYLINKFFSDFCANKNQTFLVGNEETTL